LSVESFSSYVMQLENFQHCINVAYDSGSEGDEEAFQQKKDLIQHDVPSLEIGESIFLPSEPLALESTKEFLLKMILLLVLMDCFKEDICSIIWLIE
jgi:hypothetical protein